MSIFEKARAYGGRVEARFRALTFVAATLPTFAALGIQLVAFAVTARGLGLEPFGAYTVLTSIAVVCVEIVGLGGADLLVRGLARTPRRYPFYLGNLLVLIGVTFPIALVAGTLVAVFFSESSLPLPSIVLVLAGEIVVGRLAASVELVMVAHRHAARAGWVRLLVASLRCATAVVFFLVLGLHDLGTWILVAALQSFATAAALLVLVLASYGRPRFRLMMRELGDGAGFWLNQISRASQGNVDRLILSRFADDASVGIYSASSRVLMVGLLPIQVATRVTYPNFFRHGHQGGLPATRRYAVKVAPFMLAIGVGAGVAAAAVGQLVPQLLGRDFASMSTVAAFLSLALPMIALQYPAADALTGAGFQRIRVMLSLVATFGFGLVMAAGAALGGTMGVVVAFVACHAALAASLWAAAFLCSDDKARRA
jgi:O-antigen/teichoic acid export membrane protein